MRHTPGSFAWSALLLTVVLAGCSTTPGSGSGRSGSAAAPSTKPASTTAVTSDASGWFAGNLVTLTGSSYNASTREITVSASVENTANTDALDDHFIDSITLDTGSGRPLSLRGDELDAVASSTSKVDFVFEDAQPDTLADAVLQLGAVGERRWLLPLKPGATAKGLAPVTIPATGVADADGMAFTIDHVEVLPWECWDSDDLGPSSSGRVFYKPAAARKLGVVLRGDISESRSIVGGDTLKAATLTQPDGVSVPEIGTVNRVFDLNEGVTDFALCFTIDAPAGGSYTLSWNSYRGAVATFAFAVAGSIG